MSSEALHQNKCSFTFKKPRKGQRGGEINCCRLNKAAFITVNTPTYVEGMTVEDANTLWKQYLARINRAR